VRVAALAGQRDRVGVVRAELPAVVDAAEKLLDTALPLAKLDLVVVPHFFGAMENPGLITFDEGVLVAKSGDASRTAFRHHFTRTAAHEIVHQWFGDLVTPAWWDDLWLAESFASWLGDRIAGTLGAFGDVDLEYAHRRHAALEADSEPDAKPLRRRIEHNEDPDNGFDAIAYEKGEVVLEMFAHARPAFDDTVKTLLRQHRNSTVTTKDLLALLDADAAAALADSIDHAGAPIVELTSSCKEIDARVRDHRIVPMCITYDTGGECKLVNGTAAFAVAGCTTWISGNHDAGYYQVAWQPKAPLPPVAQLGHREVLALGDDLADALGRGDIRAPDAIVAITHLARSGDPYAQLAALAIARALDPFFDDATRTAWNKFLADRFAPRLTTTAVLAPKTPVETELRDDLAELVPPSALPAETVRAAARELEARPDPAIAAFAAPVAGRAGFDRLARLARTTTDPDVREAAVAALGAFGADQIDRALDFFIATPDVTAEDAWPAVSGFFDRASTRAAAWRATSAKLPKIISRMSADEAPAVLATVASLCDSTSRAEVVAALTPRLHDIVDGRAHFDKALAKIDRCIARRAHAGDVAHALP
jgi:alanyl aminopeptidase